MPALRAAEFTTACDSGFDAMVKVSCGPDKADPPTFDGMSSKTTATEKGFSANPAFAP
jgi:hypothetical protein